MTCSDLTHTELIEKRLEELVPPTHQEYAPLLQATRYALMGGGKRLRPQLVLATCEALGQDPYVAVDPACAIEMVHCYSLIHDDLPCMDDDDLRRGQPTTHKAFNEWLAVLSGDLLLTQAFSTLSAAPNLSDSQRLQLIQVVSKRSGAHGMLGGQTIDLYHEGQTLDHTLLSRMHELKTGAMIQASLECGAICAHATEEQQSLLQDFGRMIGLAFQVIDDVLDITAPEKKGRSSDLVNEKTTYVGLLGLQGAQKEAQRLYSEAITVLDSLDLHGDALHKIASALVHRTR